MVADVDHQTGYVNNPTVEVFTRLNDHRQQGLDNCLRMEELGLHPEKYCPYCKIPGEKSPRRNLRKPLTPRLKLDTFSL